MASIKWNAYKIMVGLIGILLSGCNSGNLGLWQDLPNEIIVFMSRADHDAGELYMVKKDGTVQRLTYNERYENNPALSRDGSKIAFHAGVEADPLSYEIYVLDIATGEEFQVTDNRLLDGHPDWSPDGTKLVFSTFVDGEGNPAETADIFVVDLQTGAQTRLTDSPYEDNDPEWSHDGSMIAFKSTRNTKEQAREEIYVMDADGSNPRRLTTTSGWESDHDPSWSPDDTRISFYRFEGTRQWFDIADVDIFVNHWDELSPWNAFVVDLAGNATRLTNETDIVTLPVFSGDGSKILYINGEFIFDNNQLIGMNHFLYLANPDGSGAQQLLPTDRHTPTLEYHDW